MWLSRKDLGQGNSGSVMKLSGDGLKHRHLRGRGVLLSSQNNKGNVPIPTRVNTVPSGFGLLPLSQNLEGLEGKLTKSSSTWGKRGNVEEKVQSGGKPGIRAEGPPHPESTFRYKSRGR